MAEKTRKTARRELRQWTQARYGRTTRLASECGVARQTVYNWIEGSATPSLDDVEAIDRVTEGAVGRDTWFE